MWLIKKKNVDTLPPNFLGAESDEEIAIDAIGFESRGIGPMWSLKKFLGLN